ncbi:MAG: sigma-70 family RNA polymerase sigma factor [Dehalococcoidia bacterium]|nr:sigma-70 family RNA polymerase sigma factor [Dehalococcoidia bacterium]
MSVARNRAIDERRRMARRLQHEERDDPAAPEPPDPDRSFDPPLEAELAEERLVVREAMTRLPAAQREVIELAYFSGMTQVEIASRTGDPLGTVKTRIRLALQKLRADLGVLRTRDRT